MKSPNLKDRGSGVLIRLQEIQKITKLLSEKWDDKNIAALCNFKNTFRPNEDKLQKEPV